MCVLNEDSAIDPCPGHNIYLFILFFYLFISLFTRRVFIYLFHFLFILLFIHFFIYFCISVFIDFIIFFLFLFTLFILFYLYYLFPLFYVFYFRLERPSKKVLVSQKILIINQPQYKTENLLPLIRFKRSPVLTGHNFNLVYGRSNVRPPCPPNTSIKYMSTRHVTKNVVVQKNKS